VKAGWKTPSCDPQPSLRHARHDQLRDHLAAFLDAYNFARRLKTLRGLTPYEATCRAWADDPSRFRYDPTHLTSGLNT
jgi:hypothetical protein